MSYEVIKSITQYKGKFLSVKEDTITLPDGKTASREVVQRMPIDKQGNVILVRQYHHGVG